MSGYATAGKIYVQLVAVVRLRGGWTAFSGSKIAGKSGQMLAVV